MVVGKNETYELISNAEDLLHEADLLVKDAKGLFKKAVEVPGAEIEPWMQEDLKIVKAISLLLTRFFYKDENETFKDIISELAKKL